MIQVTYPNEGHYANGKPRLEVLNATGQITSSREATIEEALMYDLITEMRTLINQLQHYGDLR